jgi:cell volume regulation protein A
VETVVVFAVVAGIIAIGFAGEFLFKKTGMPIFIFLILTGIILGPILDVFPREPLIPALSIFAELTLLMVLFSGGMGLKSASVLSGGGRALVQTLIYVISSIIIIGFLGFFVLNWSLLPSFIFASMIGGETTAAVVVPLSRSMKLSEVTSAFLTMESAMNSILSIVLFFAFVNIYSTGSSNWLTSITDVASQFSVGIVFGAILSIGWVIILHRFQKQKFTYVLTLGLVLATYSLTSELGGNGILAVLVFGIILGNYYLLNRIFKKNISMDSLQKQLGIFHEEISFLMETLFFVFLGLTFVIEPTLVTANLMAGVIIVAVLLSLRFVATQVSTFNSELKRDRKIILFMCAQGLTPASLAILAVSLQIPLADTFLNVATYVIILTNIVATAGSIFNMRLQKRSFRESGDFDI